jgi:PAS domain S-box-containing protein
VTDELAMERLRTLIIDSAALGVIALDTGGRVVFTNPEASRILAFEPSELEGERLHDLVHAHRRDGSPYPFDECPIAAALTDGERHHIDTENFARKGGATFPVTYMSSPMRDGSRIVGAVVVFRDITDRRSAVEALRDSEERYRALVSALDEGIIVREPSGALWAANEAATKILFHDPDTDLPMSERDWTNLREDGTPFPEGESPGALTQRTGKPLTNLVLGMARQDVETRWLRMSTRPLFRPGKDEPYSVVISVRDITEARKAEEALRESEQRFRSLAAFSPIGIYWMDGEGHLKWANARALELLGLTLQEALGLGYRVALHEDHRGRLDELLRGGLDRDGQSMQLRVGKEARWVHWRSAPIRSASGDLRGFVGSLVDITSDVQAQLERETEYRLLVDNATDLISRHGPDGTFVFVSPNCEHLLGYTEDELLGRSVLDLLDDDVTHRGSSLAERLTGALKMQRKDGTRAWFEATAWPVREQGSGQVLETIVVSHDATERRRTEEELREKEAMLRQAQKMEAIGQLAGGIAHDFNNLLTAIMGYASMLSHDLQMDPAVAGHEIIEAAERAQSLTSQLLAFSRKQVLAPSPLDINEIVTNFRRMLDRLIGDRIVIETHLAPDLPAVELDRGQFEQCLMNLTINARDAMHDGGTLRIVTALTDVTTTDQRELDLPVGRYVTVSIEDTGVGMSDDVRARIFEPFFTTKDTKGTGLGLSTVYGIVKQSGGSIEVSSSPGEGSTFVLYLAATPSSPQSIRQPRDRHFGPRGNETILLVEDEAIVSRLAQLQLSELGYRVLTARDGTSALALSDEHAGKIDLLLTDIVMLGMNGRELARKLVERRPDIRVLYMSGYLDTAVDPASGDIRDNFLAKPFTATALARRVREALDR